MAGHQFRETQFLGNWACVNVALWATDKWYCNCLVNKPVVYKMNASSRVDLGTVLNRIPLQH